LAELVSEINLPPKSGVFRDKENCVYLALAGNSDAFTSASQLPPNAKHVA